jgi:acetyltransferase-like isoleucine patch superfamily enzyme
MNEDQPSSGTERSRRPQPLARTLRDIAGRTWIRVFVSAAAVIPALVHVAAWPLEPYKGRRKLFRYLGKRPYISLKAQIGCPQLELGPRCFIDDYVTIYAHPRATGGVYLEENVHIYRWSIVELGDGPGSLVVGRNTYIQAGCTLNAFLSSIVIGANCMIAARCGFMPYNHGFGNTSLPMREQPLTSKGDIILEDDVWLGINVSVMDGVTIGQGAIVGAGSVVTQDIPPYTIAAGIPARVIRARESTDAGGDRMKLSQISATTRS